MALCFLSFVLLSPTQYIQTDCDTPCEEMRSVKMIPTEEETEEQIKLFSDMMQMIANEWDPHINNLKKKSLPLQPNKLMEIKKAKKDAYSDLDDIYCLNRSSSIAALVVKISKKLRYSYNFFKFYDEDHSILQERAEQFTTAIILAELEASKNQHPEEDDDDSEDKAPVSPIPGKETGEADYSAFLQQPAGSRWRQQSAASPQQKQQRLPTSVQS